MKGINSKVHIFTYIFLLSAFMMTNRLAASYKIYVQILLLFPAIIVFLRMAHELKAARNNYEELIQKKQKAEKENEQLIKRNNEFEQLLNSLDVIVFSYDVPSGSLYLSKAAEQMLGTLKELPADHLDLWKAFVHPNDQKEFDYHVKRWLSGTASKYEHRIICIDESVRWGKTSVTPLRIDGHVMKLHGTFIDITEAKKMEAKLTNLAYYDSLTDLPNRQMMQMYLKKALARSKRHEQMLTVMFIDLDGFKNVNDTLGHEAGDVLLKEVANRLNRFVREEDFVSRLGGDEFIVVLEETGKKEAGDIAQRILDEVAKPYVISEETVRVSPSIGISIYPEHGENKAALIENADKAMYFAKNSGKNNYKFYSADLFDIQSKKIGIFEKMMNRLKGE